MIPMPSAETLALIQRARSVAEAYQRAGLVTEAKPSNEYTPADFSERRGLTLKIGALGSEIIIKEG